MKKIGRLYLSYKNFTRNEKVFENSQNGQKVKSKLVSFFVFGKFFYFPIVSNLNVPMVKEFVKMLVNKLAKNEKIHDHVQFFLFHKLISKKH